MNELSRCCLPSRRQRVRRVWAGLAGAAVVSAHGAVHDLASDWSDAVNPFGPWALYKSPTQVFSIHWDDYSPGGELDPAWADQQAWLPMHVPVWARSVDGTFVWAHSAEFDRTGTNITFARWTSPEDGLATVVGDIWSVGTPGRTVRWEIRVDGTSLTGASLLHDGTWTAGHPFDFASGSGGSGALSFPITVGTTVDLVLVSLDDGGSLGDSVAMHYTITTVPEPGSLAWSVAGVAGAVAWSRRRR